jgi:ribonuclease HepT-like protein
MLPRIPWKQIADLRDRVIHDYFGVNLDIVWAIVEKDLPPLRHAPPITDRAGARDALQRRPDGAILTARTLDSVPAFAPECER